MLFIVATNIIASFQIKEIFKPWVLLLIHNWSLPLSVIIINWPVTKVGSFDCIWNYFHQIPVTTGPTGFLFQFSVFSFYSVRASDTPPPVRLVTPDKIDQLGRFRHSIKITFRNSLFCKITIKKCFNRKGEQNRSNECCYTERFLV